LTTKKGPTIGILLPWLPHKFSLQPRVRLELLIVALLAVLIVLPLIAARSGLQWFRVEGSSMIPTLLNGDMVLVATSGNQASHMPSRGDIIVFHSPAATHYPAQLLIKRVIGLPNDTITIRPVSGTNHVFVDGQALHESYTRGAPRSTLLLKCRNPKGCTYKVPAHAIFVLGDNRLGSVDSRWWGPVPIRAIVGRVLVSYRSPVRISFLAS